MSLLLLLLSLTLLSGCGDKEKKEYVSYQIGAGGRSLEENKFSFQSEDAEGMIEEVVAYLNEDRMSDQNEWTASADAQKEIPLLPSDVEISAWQKENGRVILTFSESYGQMDQVREILCRDGIVQMLLQIPDVNGVEFYIGGEELKDASGDSIGIMDADTFVTNPGSEINSVKTTSLTLFFANEEGNGLVKEEQEVRYLSSRSLERLVVEQVISGPEGEMNKATVPAETEVINVAVSNGVCYVNLGSEFTRLMSDVSPQITIYSLVDSLCQLDEVDYVQISIDGETNLLYANAISLDQVFEEDDSYLSAGDEAADSAN